MTTPTQLQSMANKLRREVIEETTAAGSGHPTSCLSCADILSTLFFDQFKKGDEFILSKGHAAPILWASFAESGLIPRDMLQTLRKINSTLEGHPTKRMKYVRIATGSLGQGLSAGVGMALASQMQRSKRRIYVLLGDGELAEGSVWEAANVAHAHNLQNLCAIVDVNRLGQSQETMHGHDLQVYQKKFEAFGWSTILVDGHDIKKLQAAFSQAQRSGKPQVILAQTIKGKGVPSVEDQEGFHGKPFSVEDSKKALDIIPDVSIQLKSPLGQFKEYPLTAVKCEQTTYQKGEKVATRKAFGTTLVKLGMDNKNLVVIDGDVRNSTKTDGFFKKYPKRAIQGYIAEQNMVGMGMGFSALGMIPYVVTFSTFLTRAHDFIRMAQYSNVSLKIVGSHTGVSIGEDGPSQMGLEDLSMFLHIPETTVLNPCDAVSTDALAREQITASGISYLRTIREDTPVIYNNSETFRIGGSKVHHKNKDDKAVIFATGITVHEALKARDILNEQGIPVRVVDLYSLKPLDTTGIKRYAKGISTAIVVEDHYKAEVGALVASLIGPVEQMSVDTTPRSGTAKELRALHQIDAQAIVRRIKRCLSR